MSQPTRREPWIHTWTDEHGIDRQTKVHYTRDDRSVIFDPRFPGDPEPWFDADRALDDPSARYEDADLVTLGDPNDPHFGEVDPDLYAGDLDIDDDIDM